MASHTKLTRNSKAVSFLRKLLESGELTWEEDPKTVWESNLLFQVHKLANFRSCYNRYRKEYLEEKDSQPMGTEDLNTRCTNNGVTTSGKKRRFIDLEADSDDGSSYKSQIPLDKHLVRPLNLIAAWMEPKTTTRRITVVVLLTTGVGPGDFSVSITENGKSLEVSVVWPVSLINSETLHRKWLSATGDEKLEPYHPKLLAFEAALKGLRSNASESVVSLARIDLPFKVETHIHAKFNLAWRNSTSRMVYVDLREAMGTYGLVNDNEEFEEV